MEHCELILVSMEYSDYIYNKQSQKQIKNTH